MPGRDSPIVIFYPSGWENPIAARNYNECNYSIATQQLLIMPSSSEIKHEFGALNTLLLTVILGLCVVSAYLVKQNKIYFIPESAAAILVGLIVGVRIMISFSD